MQLGQGDSSAPYMHAESVTGICWVSFIIHSRALKNLLYMKVDFLNITIFYIGSIGMFVSNQIIEKEVYHWLQNPIENHTPDFKSLSQVTFAKHQCLGSINQCHLSLRN